ncbi:hypothetical protein PIB30_024992 [Stylosanthes scabra]|uniref:Uncharacterized protein n=1 Tax=Stylosanthes scabra TaxID=79078 RepID=A0ABU6Y764_9FABA|nr:hypothetical protein [Stylosanthes scabra]
MGSASGELGCLREALVGVCGPQLHISSSVQGCRSRHHKHGRLRSTHHVVDLSEVFEILSGAEGHHRIPTRLELKRDNHEKRMVQIRQALDRLDVHEDDPQWEALRPAWMLTEEEQMTWQAVVPIVCFMYSRMHHVDRVKRQFGGEQQIPEDPVNLDGLLGVNTRGENQHWPTRQAEWYDG